MAVERVGRPVNDHLKRVSDERLQELILVWESQPTEGAHNPERRGAALTIAALKAKIEWIMRATRVKG